jgi:hypothetical protein
MMLDFSRCVVILKSRILVLCSIVLTMTLPWMMYQRLAVWLNQRVLQESSPLFGMLPWMFARKLFQLYVHLMINRMMEFTSIIGMFICLIMGASPQSVVVGFGPT